MECITPPRPEVTGTGDANLVAVRVVVHSAGSSTDAVCGTYCFFRYRSESTPTIYAMDMDATSGAGFRVYVAVAAYTDHVHCTAAAV